MFLAHETCESLPRRSASAKEKTRRQGGLDIEAGSSIAGWRLKPFAPQLIRCTFEPPAIDELHVFMIGAKPLALCGLQSKQPALALLGFFLL